MELKGLSSWFVHGSSMVPPSKRAKSMDKPWTNPLFDLLDSKNMNSARELLWRIQMKERSSILLNK